MYDFTCACSSCSLPDEESELSDHNRHQIQLLIDKLDDEEKLQQLAKDPDLSDSKFIRMFEEVWELIESERCYARGVWPAAVQSLCKVHCSLGNLEEAKKWAQAGMTLSLVFTNDEGGWREVYEAPERTAWWGLRKAFKK
jgi:hypothetical protein